MRRSLGMRWDLWRRESRGGTSISTWMFIRNFLLLEVAEFNTAFSTTVDVCGTEG